MTAHREVPLAIDTVVAETHATVFDSWTVLCADGVCATQGTGYPRYYRDCMHVSVPEGRSFGEAFTKLLDYKN